MEFLKKNWFLIAFVATPLCGGILWLATINSRIFNTPEEKVSVIKYVKDSPSPEQAQRAYIMDSLNKDSAIKTRAKRLSKELKRDSIRSIKDSIVLDYVQRNAEQIYQIKEIIKSK